MTVVLVVQSALLLVLCVLVAGLLRAYADVLRRLHRLDGGVDAAASAITPPVAAPPFRVRDGVVAPAAVELEGRDTWAAASDLRGETPDGGLASLRVVSVQHDTVLAFLSSGCTACERFWEELRGRAGWAPPAGARLVVVTRGRDAESPALVADLAAPGVEVLMSSSAWDDYEVPGSPYLVVVDGSTGRVKGQGSGASFSQLGSLVAQAASDTSSPVRKPAADREREQDVDRELARSGILPGHPSLYVSDDAAATGPRT